MKGDAMNGDAMNGDARLEALAKRLGTDAAERLNVEATTSNVLAGLRQAPTRRPTWIELYGLRIAAAIALLVGGSFAVSRLTQGPRPEVSQHAAHLVADDLGDLNADELRDVLAQLDQIVGSDSVVSDSTDLRELDAQELRAVLRSLEG